MLTLSNFAEQLLILANKAEQDDPNMAQQLRAEADALVHYDNEPQSPEPEGPISRDGKLVRVGDIVYSSVTLDYRKVEEITEGTRWGKRYYMVYLEGRPNCPIIPSSLDYRSCYETVDAELRKLDEQIHLRQAIEAPADLCDLCGKWVADHRGSTPEQLCADYPQMMGAVLTHFGVAKPDSFIAEACDGNWKRLHETDTERCIGTHEYAQRLLDEACYCSDRWSWDRILRVQWLYMRLRKRCKPADES